MMSVDSWIERTMDWLRRLAARPGVVFALLFTANALARPYANFAHDARLYGVQVLNQVEPGAFADDLFLKYGSQDQFSLFSRVAAPLVAAFGLEVTFFALYLAFNSLFILALQRLVFALLADGALALLSLLFMMVAPLPFGGLAIFQVHEPFLTPRIMANALVLFGLGRLLARRFAVSLLFMLAAASMHVLMAQGGLLIWLLVLAWDRLPRQLFFGLMALGSAAGVAVLVYEPAGLALFGAMDDSWREIVRLASAYNFPSAWSLRDWLNVFLSVAFVAGAAWMLRHEAPDEARFLGITAFVGVAGFLGTVIAAKSPYALLFQAQPYRVLWIAKALQAPLGFYLAVRLWRGTSLKNAGAAADDQTRILADAATCGGFEHGDLEQTREVGLQPGSGAGLEAATATLTANPARFQPGPTARRLLAAGIVASFWITSDNLLECCFPLFFFPILALALRGLDPTPRTTDWLGRAALFSLIAGCIGWGVYKTILIVGGADQFLALIDGLDLVRLVMDHLGPMFWLFFLIALAGWLVAGGRARAGAILGLGAGLQAMFFVLPYLPAYRRATRHQAHLEELADFLDNARQDRKTRPTIYCSLGRIDYLWLDLQANSYFDWAQIVGCLFNRGTAEEGRRRALMVRAFEVSRIQEGLRFMPEQMVRDAEGLFAADVRTLRPSRADLELLCLQEHLDYVIVKQEYPGLVTASFGQVHLYDCRAVRAALRAPGAHAVGELAAGVPLKNPE